MVTEADVIALREKVLTAWGPFAIRRGLPTAHKGCTAEQAHFMAMGAMAFANAVLELPDRPDNIGKLIIGIEADNEAARSEPAERGE